jgi:hypothetical protein
MMASKKAGKRPFPSFRRKPESSVFNIPLPVYDYLLSALLAGVIVGIGSGIILKSLWIRMPSSWSLKPWR